MTHKATLAVVAAMFLAAAPAAGEETDYKAQAVQAAQEWLATVDAGSYGESWQKAAGYFRNAVSNEQWQGMLSAVRAPLGAVQSRQVKSSIFKTQLPGVPDGEYVVVQFATSFANKQDAVETVTPMRDADGAWRVSGYYIK
jgi:hypothetical protein